MSNYQEFKSVHIVFENCEHIEIPAENIHYMHIGNLNDTVTKPWSNENTLSFHKDTDIFVIHFENREEYKRIFQHKDITQIHIYYTDDTENVGDLWFYVPWSDDQYYNEKQENEVDDKYIKVEIR